MDNICHMLSYPKNVPVFPIDLPWNCSSSSIQEQMIDSFRHCLDDSFTFAPTLDEEGCFTYDMLNPVSQSHLSTPQFLATQECIKVEQDDAEYGRKRKTSCETDVSCVTTCSSPQNSVATGSQVQNTSLFFQLPVKLEEDQEKSLKKKRANVTKEKCPKEVPKEGFVHVRARRGQATDSHSLAERVRREKISQRMKFLQSLVPGCSKITGKALMLDEIINYVQSLQQQVEYLSTKLSSITSQTELHNLESLKEMLYHHGCGGPTMSGTGSGTQLLKYNEQWSIPGSHFMYMT